MPRLALGVGRRCAELGVVAGTDTVFRPAKRAIAGNSTFATPARAPTPSSVTRRASHGGVWACLAATLGRQCAPPNGPTGPLRRGPVTSPSTQLRRGRERLPARAAVTADEDGGPAGRHHDRPALARRAEHDGLEDVAGREHAGVPVDR